MKQNHFSATPQNPYHLSVGAVVLNDEGKVACHHFVEFELDGERLTDFYILMRETMEPDESIEEALDRGLLEEFGIKAELTRYLGSIVSSFGARSKVQKTTIYFEMKFLEQKDDWRRADDPEKDAEKVWKEPSFLIESMTEQGKRLHRTDLDESEVLKRLNVL
jgi:ADP-ribose pyrophosphatase YjhB (NUDIX family)